VASAERGSIEKEVEKGFWAKKKLTTTNTSSAKQEFRQLFNRARGKWTAECFHQKRQVGEHKKVVVVSRDDGETAIQQGGEGVVVCELCAEKARNYC